MVKYTDTELVDSFQSSTWVTNEDEVSGTRFTRLMDGFRRHEVVIPEGVDLSKMDEYERNNFILAHQPFRKTLSQRHLTMISIGGTLGTGLFIGIGGSLTEGPGALLLGFAIVGLSIFCVIQSAAELSCQYPVSGSFATHVSRFLEPSIGFTVSNAYALSWLISFPNELTGLAMTMRHWNTSVNPSVWVTIFYVIVIALNLFAVRGFAEAEFWLSIVKILAIIVFLVIGIVIICGGGPGNENGYLGAKYWHDPGSFKKPYFNSLCNTFISAAFTFGGAELVILTASESRKVESISRAAKGTFWRIAIFYISTVAIIGCLVPYTDERLNGNNSNDVATSPFVLALSGTSAFSRNIGHFMNAIILVAVISVANSSVYAASRVMQSLGACGQLPSIFAYVDKRGRPLVGILVSALFGLLAFLVNVSNVTNVFNWLFALCSISSFFTWWCICVSQLRFRKALKAQGLSTDDIAFKSMMGIWSGILGTILNTILIVGEVYVSVKDGDAKTFFQNCLSIPLMICAYVIHKFYKRNKQIYIPAERIDLSLGQSPRDVELMKHENTLRKTKIASSPWYYRTYRFWC
ncbi:HFL255Cp [Eremothecium sinecaudum]|uniref:HFL255Cp n=1 Tax=Eremothecium sinecaudum TaxID=45286 RepID=A0A109UZP4_9SACH|nr:HFL255Cp [Eremothecium sinecaudum]AMD21601.1 HFL255Cp [Eremothecium sinecaudum]